MKTDGRQYQAGEDMDARVKRLEAECERLRPDAFTPSLRELQHGLNCLSVDNEMDRPDFQLAWDIYEAAKQCATPPPESEPHHVPPIVNNTPDGKPDEIPNDAPHTPEQTGDALAALEALKSWAGSRAEQSGDPALAHSNIGMWARTIRHHLTASSVSYVPESIRALPAEWRACVDQHGAYLSEVAANQRGVYRKCAEELERAIASAPADGSE